MRRPTHPRGFTIILAITLFGMIAVAAAMIVHQLGYELQRTRTAYEDAQLRQLLVAGAQEVATEPSASTGQPVGQARQIDLPPSLVSQGGSLSISQIKSGGDVLILAHLGTREATQTLHFDDQSHHWKVLAPAE